MTTRIGDIYSRCVAKKVHLHRIENSGYKRVFEHLSVGFCWQSHHPMTTSTAQAAPNIVFIEQKIWKHNRTDEANGNEKKQRVLLCMKRTRFVLHDDAILRSRNKIE